MIEIRPCCVAQKKCHIKIVGIFESHKKVKVMPKGLSLPCVSVICDISVLRSFPHDPVDCNLLVSILENELCTKYQEPKNPCECIKVNDGIGFDSGSFIHWNTDA